MTTPLEAMNLARLFHDTYERLAPEFGYQTRDDTKQFDPESPNGKLMVAVCEVVRTAIAQLESAEPVAIGNEWMPCVKLPIVVHVREQRPNETHVSTREGITPVRPDDLIMRGVAGEEYPIGRELFNKTYTFDTHPPAAIPPDVVRDAERLDALERMLLKSAELSAYINYIHLDADHGLFKGITLREAIDAAMKEQPK